MNRLDICRYWQNNTQTINHKISPKESLENFSFLLKESISKRLRSDLPIGTSLSGGVDRSAIVSLVVNSNALKP